MGPIERQYMAAKMEMDKLNKMVAERDATIAQLLEALKKSRDLLKEAARRSNGRGRGIAGESSPG